jgi:hypothetical protein
MKYLALFSLFAFNAVAGDLPKEFVHHYTPSVDIVLMPDVCNKADLSQGWIAQAREGDKHADGCWIYSKHQDTVLIYLDAGNGVYLDYELYKSKFEAKF